MKNDHFLSVVWLLGFIIFIVEDLDNKSYQNSSIKSLLKLSIIILVWITMEDEEVLCRYGTPLDPLDEGMYINLKLTKYSFL